MAGGRFSLYIKVSGKSKLTRKRTREAALFFANRLMSSRLIETLDVTINFIPHLWRKERLTGEVEAIQDDTATPRIFEIRINSQESYLRSLEILAHEFVHIKQYATGELKEFVYRPNTSRYRGKEFITNNIKDEDSYWDSPWEIEAYGRETGLRIRFVKSLDKKKKT